MKYIDQYSLLAVSLYLYGMIGFFAGTLMHNMGAIHLNPAILALAVVMVACGDAIKVIRNGEDLRSWKSLIPGRASASDNQAN